MLDHLFSRPKKKPPVVVPQKEDTPAQRWLDSLEDTLGITYRNRNVTLKGNAVWQEIQALDKAAREEIALLCFRKLIDKHDQHYDRQIVRRKIFKSEFNAKNPPSEAALIKLFSFYDRILDSHSYGLPLSVMLFCFQYYKETYGKDEHYLKARTTIIDTYRNSYRHHRLKELVLELERMGFAGNDLAVYDRRDVLGQYLDVKWEAYDETVQELFVHCWRLGQRSKPTTAWTKQANELLHEVKEKDQLVNHLSGVFEFLAQAGKAEVKRRNEGNSDHRKNTYLLRINATAVSYLIWLAAMLDHQVLNSRIGELALVFYRKIRWVGPLSIKNGNACMYAFTLMSPKAGITQLLNTRNKSSNKSIRNTANKYLALKAEELGISEEALLELSVPSFNLEQNHSKWVMGEYTGVIDITDMTVPLVYWLNNATNKRQKSVPKEVRENHKEELKAFKTTLKELKTAVSVHAKRLENSYLDAVEWSLEDWQSNYLDHPFLSRYATKLIWWFDDKQTGIVHDGQIMDVNKIPLDISQYERVKVWHPIYSDVDLVSAWRNYMLDEEIKQPFKQAYREIYVLTDAEINTNTYSNRFAAHILYQYQFTALAKIRDWSYTLQGAFDSHNTPTRSIPKFNLSAQFWVEPINDETNNTGIYNYIASDQVRFYNGREHLEMAAVPKLVFSEIMRDVDLFVGVTSIGNNPQWQDVGERRNYWHEYSFGGLSETGNTRKEVLERIIPKLKIADRCTIQDKFLVVEGRIRQYKIHLGSGNILMSPNDQYLCIVPGSRNPQKEIFLPFDNDRTLSIIISKAFLLYDDDKITDITITNQIKL